MSKIRAGPKSGRKQMREITMAGQKRGRQNEEDGAPDVASAEESDSVPDTEFAEAEKEDTEQHRGQVYDALLTLLKSEHPEKKPKSHKKAKKEAKGTDENASGNEEVESEDEQQNVDKALEEISGGLVDEEDMQDSLSDVDESEDETDPFEVHFNKYDESRLNALDKGFKSKSIKYKSSKSSVSNEESVIFSKPSLNDEEVSPIRGKQTLSSYFIKQKLKIASGFNDTALPLSDIQKELVDPMFQYKDMLYEYSDYSDEDQYRELYTLHVLNHVYKTRDRILKNNQKLHENNDEELLDQGFTRPKVLIVVPTRDVAHKIVRKIMAKSGLDQFDKKSKFEDQFFEDSLPPTSKPKSFQHIFQGNTNDFFVLGLKFTRKSLKLYSNFYQSDVIICSPLGIQLILENTDKKKRQDDFLSSMEIMIIDQLHSIEYQNAMHISTIFEHINKIPEQQREADFGRIRMWYINEQAKFFRQTMVFTKYVSPFANSIINGKCRNIEGRWKNHRKIEPERSSIGQLGLKVRQIFQRFDLAGGTALDEPDYRFKFFTSVTVPHIVKSTGYEDGILLYIPDYTDFIRVRNYLKEKTTIMFGEINEYSDQKQLTSNRAKFQHGKAKVLLYTERLHHFRRYEIKNVKSVIFYKPPGNPEFYPEVVRNIGKNVFLGNCDINISTVRCIYSKMDSLALERIVGSKRAAVLAHGQNEVYEFK
ncbi:unnamed protein product [Kluyveromyces dobzhanskii CBS 2104]|uniref:U3 small nucleolar RNA-associated protein 25 n=1 Tax=Kluyveromyces dobzhanskii CBS 2104 TaxID=1427455 RepID=A0A0A8L8P4_9SACH|nr:unnamed protein product [Kluyveromyces dobzhanskii CBS 2104]